MVRRACRAVGFLLILLLGACAEPEITSASREVRDFGSLASFAKLACGATPTTFVRDSRGTNCDTFEADVAGWSTGCVSACDTPARLQEANASAAGTCAKFCSDRGCPNNAFNPERACSASQCYAREDCPRECPQRNYCTIHEKVGWNCRCVAP